MPRPAAVLRLLALLVAIFVAGQASGASAFLGGQECAESCPDDDAEGNCAPFCDDCVCCPHPRSVAPPGAVQIAAASTSVLQFFRVAVSLGDPHPRGIEHIPKSFLA